MRHYIAYIHKEEDSDYGISFYDFPGCISAGSTMEEATFMAQDALAGHIECMAEHGEKIPKPSAIAIIKANAEDNPILLPVPVVVKARKKNIL